MKIRYGVVSNSSSSSFIVISESSKLDQELTVSGDNVVRLGIEIGGICDFNWNFAEYNDVLSKCNFAWVQANDCCDDHLKQKWKWMLDEAIKQHTGASYVVWDWGDRYHYNPPYVDHKSSSREGKNIEMFDSIDHLVRFLFNSTSLIVVDNDN